MLTRVAPQRQKSAVRPNGKDRHLIDLKLHYILLDDPRFIDQRGCLSTFEPIYPNLAY
jgi:hypothetical protein